MRESLPTAERMPAGVHGQLAMPLLRGHLRDRHLRRDRGAVHQAVEATVALRRQADEVCAVSRVANIRTPGGVLPARRCHRPPVDSVTAVVLMLALTGRVLGQATEQVAIDRVASDVGGHSHQVTSGVDRPPSDIVA